MVEEQKENLIDEPAKKKKLVAVIIAVAAVVVVAAIICVLVMHKGSGKNANEDATDLPSVSESEVVDEDRDEETTAATEETTPAETTKAEAEKTTAKKEESPKTLKQIYKDFTSGYKYCIRAYMFDVTGDGVDELLMVERRPSDPMPDFIVGSVFSFDKGTDKVKKIHEWESMETVGAGGFNWFMEENADGQNALVKVFNQQGVVSIEEYYVFDSGKTERKSYTETYFVETYVHEEDPDNPDDPFVPLEEYKKIEHSILNNSYPIYCSSDHDMFLASENIKFRDFPSDKVIKQ
ncbi:MAG: hypothetical protein IJU39_04350 [Clostridia bacterium]|nr:hypothetical protein [Clostridia bacterium]